MRLPARTSRADSGPGLMHTRSRSAVGHDFPIACSCMYTRICASTRSAVRRSASSRNAIRLPLRKKCLTASSACSGM